jgi:translation elongation factor EF-4
MRVRPRSDRTTALSFLLVFDRSGQPKMIENPSDFPSNSFDITEAQEPYISATIVVPDDTLGDVLQLCEVCVSLVV